jgi:hypothetical protein
MSDTTWKPSGQVFIEGGAPYLAHRGWIWKWNGDGGWYNIAKLNPLTFASKICTPEETALYGVNYSEDIHGS